MLALARDVAERVPANRRKDLMLIHMGDAALQPQLNLFDLGPGDPRFELQHPSGAPAAEHCAVAEFGSRLEGDERRPADDHRLETRIEQLLDVRIHALILT